MFVNKLAPKKINYSVVLLDDPIMEYTDKQEDQLEYALVYVEHGRYEKAEQLLSDLLDSTSDSSFVTAYNLGVVKEIQGELEKARSLYMLADTSYKVNESFSNGFFIARVSIDIKDYKNSTIKTQTMHAIGHSTYSVEGAIDDAAENFGDEIASDWLF